MDQLDRAIAKYRKAQKAESDALAELHDAIRATLKDAKRGAQAEVVERTGYTRERIRQIMKEGSSGDR